MFCAPFSVSHSRTHADLRSCQLTVQCSKDSSAGVTQGSSLEADSSSQRRLSEFAFRNRKLALLQLCISLRRRSSSSPDCKWPPTELIHGRKVGLKLTLRCKWLHEVLDLPTKLLGLQLPVYDKGQILRVLTEYGKPWRRDCPPASWLYGKKAAGLVCWIIF